MPKLTGGGYNSRQVAHYVDPKSEPRPHSVSVGSVSRLGAVVGEGTPHKNLYNAVGYTVPNGVQNNDCRVGGNNRRIMPSGSQSKTPAPTPMGRGRSLFK
jgi:hypothetical protein